MYPFNNIQNTIKISGLENSLYLPLLRHGKLQNMSKILTKKKISPLLDTKKDIWDIGILTYELLLGKLPIFVQKA